MFTYILSVFDCGLDGIFTPEDGALSYNTTTFGSVATFECFDNFSLLGKSERSCQRTGWSNSNPTCGKERMYTMDSFTIDNFEVCCLQNALVAPHYVHIIKQIFIL